MPLSALTPAPVITKTRSVEEMISTHEKCTPAVECLDSGTPPEEQELVCGHALRFLIELWRRRLRGLAAQFRFQRGQPGFDIVVCLSFADDFLAIPAQEIIDG